MFVGMELSAAEVVKTFHLGLKDGDIEAVAKSLDQSVNVFEEGSMDRNAANELAGHMISDFEFMAIVKSKGGIAKSGIQRLESCGDLEVHSSGCPGS